MANSKRRYTDQNGNTFVPMNVEGGSWNEHFITTPKLIVIGLIILSAIIIGLGLSSASAKASAYVVYYIIWGFIASYLMRYIVFEEKFYYRMYKQLKESEVTTPALFWDVTSIKETGEGGILTYSDGKVGVIVKIERDTITGKTAEFKEEHYDAISDFYKELVTYRYSFVQMNIMEQAGNDPRLQELDKLLHKSDNQNIRDLMEREIGHIKMITHKTLYESDYVLIYTQDTQKIDTIISDTIDCVYKILDGAYIGYKILNSRDIIELIKEEYGVKYFSSTDARLGMFKNSIAELKRPFDLMEIKYNDGETQNIGARELNKIKSITSEVLSGTKDINKISLKDTLISRENKSKGIDFESLANGFDEENLGVENDKTFRNKFSKHQDKNNNTYSNNIQYSINYDVSNEDEIEDDDENIDF